MASSHGIDHHATGTATAQWLHQGSWQCGHEVGIDTEELKAFFYTTNQYIHCTRRTEHADSDKDGNQIGDDTHGSLEATLGSFDEGLIHIHPFAYTSHDEGNDDTEQ